MCRGAAVRQRAAPAGRGGINRRRLCAQHRVATADQLQQIRIKIEMPNRDDVHDRHTDVPLQKCRNLGDKCPAVLGTISL